MSCLNSIHWRVILAVWLLAGALLCAQQPAQPLASAVDTVNMTVSDVDRATDFYSRVLQFKKVSDVEVAGEPYERLQGVFGLRMRIVRMRLGDENVELTEYLAPKGRPVPVESRSNDQSFQHIAIIVSDMDKAFATLKTNKVRFASTAPLHTSTPRVTS